MEITREIAQKVLSLVDMGLVRGRGDPKPGCMCIEAVVCYVLGEPHGDEPSCVAPALRRFKIGLNDAEWSNDQARAAGMRRLALVQLGSRGSLDERDFVIRLSRWAITQVVPSAFRSAAKIAEEPHKENLIAAAESCERKATRESALRGREVALAAIPAVTFASAFAFAAASASAASVAAASAVAVAVAASADTAAASADTAAASADTAAASASASAVRDKTLSDFAENVVQILVEMRAPGAQWLDLAPLAPS